MFSRLYSFVLLIVLLIERAKSPISVILYTHNVTQKVSVVLCIASCSNGWIVVRELSRDLSLPMGMVDCNASGIVTNRTTKPDPTVFPKEHKQNPILRIGKEEIVVVVMESNTDS